MMYTGPPGGGWEETKGGGQEDEGAEKETGRVKRGGDVKDFQPHLSSPPFSEGINLLDNNSGCDSILQMKGYEGFTS